MNPCVSIECAPSNIASLERVRYFPGQLLAPDDMLLEQAYFRNRLRRHNRFLHGWGVVCGANVKPDPDKKPWKVIIEPGYLLDPLGNEILIDREVSVDLRCEDAVDPCADQLDPWCSDVVVDRDPERPLYIAVCYAECLARPVRVQLNGCGCDATECEYSRVRDSFSIKVLTEPPENLPCTPPRGNPLECPPNGLPDCPPCPDDPCVVIAEVRVGGNGIIEAHNISNHCRRMVVSFSEWWYCCQERPDLLSLLRRISPEVLNRLRFAAEARNLVMSPKIPESTLLSAPTFRWRLPTRESVTFPWPFEVPINATTRKVLDMYGDEEFYHPAAGQLFTVRDLLAAAGLPPEEPIESREALLHRLESEPIDLQRYLSTRAVLSGLVDPEAIRQLDEEKGGQLSELPRLKAQNITGVTPASPVSNAVGRQRITTLAGRSLNSFLEQAVKGVPDSERPQVEADAKEVWMRAKRIVDLARIGSQKEMKESSRASKPSQKS